MKRKSRHGPPHTLKGAISARISGGCPAPSRLTSDQLHCRACGMTWDVDEIRPACSVSPHPNRSPRP